MDTALHKKLSRTGVICAIIWCLSSTSVALAAPLDVSGGGTGLSSVPNGSCLSGSASPLVLTTTPCFSSTNAYTWSALQTFQGGVSIGGDSIARFSNIFNHRAYTVCASTIANKAGCDYMTDGTGDDVEIQAAYEAVASLGNLGGEVWLSAGQFNISAPIKLDRDNVTIKGAGLDATTIFVSGGANVNAIEYKGSAPIIFNSLQSFSIDGNRANNSSGVGVYIAPSGSGHFWDFYVRDVWAKNMAGDGFYSYDGHGFVLDHFLSEYNGGAGITFPSGGIDEPEIQNGTMKFNGGNGISCGANSCLVQSNEVSNNSGYGIELSAVSGSAIGNTVYLNTLSGIHITAQPYMKVTNNVVKTNRQHGILVDTSDTLILGNSVFQNSQQAANTFDEIFTAHERAIITNNTIDGGDRSRYGISFNAAWGSGNIATDNTIIGEVTSPTHDVANKTTWINGGNGMTTFNEPLMLTAIPSGGGKFLCIDGATGQVTASDTACSGAAAPIASTSSFDSMTGDVTQWFANITNGITDIFTNKIHAKQLCVSDDAGETCVTRAQLDLLLAGSSAPTPTP